MTTIPLKNNDPGTDYSLKRPSDIRTHPTFLNQRREEISSGNSPYMPKSPIPYTHHGFNIDNPTNDKEDTKCSYITPSRDNSISVIRQQSGMSESNLNETILWKCPLCQFNNLTTQTLCYACKFDVTTMKSNVETIKIKRNISQKDITQTILLPQGSSKTIPSLRQSENKFLVWTSDGIFKYSINGLNYDSLYDLTTNDDIYDRPSLCVKNNICYRIGGREAVSKKQRKTVDYIDISDPNPTLSRGAIDPIQYYRNSARSLYIESLDSIFLFGGDDNGDEISSCELYKFSTKKWSTLDNMATARNDFAVGYAKKHDKIFVAGGHNTDYGYLGSLECYDISKNKWNTNNKLNMPNNVKRTRSGGIVYNDNYFMILGGSSPFRHLAQIYDIHKDTWLGGISPSLNSYWWPIITQYKDNKSHNINEKILLVTGINTNSKHTLDNCELYDTRNNKWYTYKLNFETHQDNVNIRKMIWLE